MDREEGSKYQIVFETSPVGMALTKQDFSFLKINNAFCTMIGFSREELMKMTFRDFTHPDHFETDLKSFYDLLHGNISIYEAEKRYIRKDGSIIWGMLRLKVVRDANGECDFFLAQVEDITVRKALAEELVLKNEELHFVNAEKDRFFSIIAHDLKSPFHNFINLTRLMEEKFHTSTPEQNLKHIQVLDESALNLYRLLENLLEWARLQRGMISPFPRSFSLRHTIETCLDFFRDPARKKDITLSVNVSTNLILLADERMVNGIFRNLLSNALKFTSPGGAVTIEATPCNYDQVEVSIRDTGIGMSEKMRNTLFNIDTDARRVGTEGEPSTGLGLILCKEFVERNGGKIWVESEAGKGSVFTFTLPADMESIQIQ